MKCQCNTNCYLNKVKGTGASCKIQFCTPVACQQCALVMTNCSAFITEERYLKLQEKEKRHKAEMDKARKNVDDQ